MSHYALYLFVKWFLSSVTKKVKVKLTD